MSSIAAHLSPGRRAVVETLYAKKARRPLAAFLLCFFVGPVGLHHAYLRQWGRIWGHLPLPAIALVFAGLGLGNILTTSVALIGFLIAMGGAIVWSLSELRTVDGAADTWNAALAQRLVDQADSGQLDARIPAVTQPATRDTSAAPVAAPAVPFVAPALPPVAPEPVPEPPLAPWMSPPPAVEPPPAPPQPEPIAATPPPIEAPEEPPAYPAPPVAPFVEPVPPPPVWPYAETHEFPSADEFIPPVPSVRASAPLPAPEPIEAPVIEPWSSPSLAPAAPVAPWESYAPEPEPSPGDAAAPRIAEPAPEPPAPVAEPQPPVDDLPVEEAPSTPLELHTPEPVPVTPSRKRIRVRRKIVVDGQVIGEATLEDIIPAGEDSTQAAAALRERLAAMSPEELERLAGLPPGRLDGLLP